MPEIDTSHDDNLVLLETADESAVSPESQRRDNSNNHPVKMMVFSAVFYAVCSGSMNFINKYLMTVLDFPFPSVMIFLQLIVLSSSLKALSVCGAISLAPYSLLNAQKLALQSLLYSLNTGMGECWC